MPSSSPPSPSRPSPSSPMSRRALFGGAAAGLSLMAGLPAQARVHRAAHSTRGHQPYDKIGVQLYTVRDAFAADPLGTLQMVRVLGYDQVEMIGLAGRKPAEIKGWLDDLGLAAKSGHIGDWYNRAEASLDELAAIGASYAVMPWMPVEERADWKGFAGKLNHWGELARARGLKLAYHNHDFEFHPADGGGEFYDVLLAQTDPALVFFELDIYWAAHGGHDPAAMIRAHGPRIRMLHLKDKRPDGGMAPVGSGTLDFRGILQTAAAAKVDYVFVEHDDAKNPFDSISKSIRYLRQL